MSFVPLGVDWRSLVADWPSPGMTTPARLATPAVAWEYGAASEPIGSPYDDGVVRLRVRVTEGSLGIVVLASNYGAALTEQARLTPEDDERVLDFAFPSAFGACRLLVRNLAAAPRGGRAEVLSVELGRRGDLSAEEQAALFPPQGQPIEPPLDEDVIRWSPTRSERFTPISLGNTCEAKFQVARVLTWRRDPDASDLGFRLAMLPPRRAADRFGWELFDWQGTSLKAVQAYLERDFQGLFEREDLHPVNKGVVHKTLGTQHIHDFEVLLDDPRHVVTADVVDRGYLSVRERFDAMARGFRAILGRPGPYLYVHVCEDIPTDWTIYKLVQALRSRSPYHRFRLLFVGYDDSDTPWGAYANAVADKALRPRKWLKPEGREWEGPDAAWDAALAPYALAFPDGSPADARSRTDDTL